MSALNFISPDSAVLPIVIAGLWGGLMAVEREAFLQAMISRPLVAATGLGLLLGDVSSGLFIGMALELFYLGDAHMGGVLPKNDTLAATCATAACASMANAAGSESTPALWAFSLLVFLPFSFLGRRIERLFGQYANRLWGKAHLSAERGELTRAIQQNLWGMWPMFWSFGLLTAACALIGLVLRSLEWMPLPLLTGLAWAYPVMVSVAAAIAVRGSHAQKAHWYGGIAALLVVSIYGFGRFV